MLLSVDPGLGRTGYAIWIMDGSLHDSGVVTTKDLRATNWKLRAERIAGRVAKLCRGVDGVVCEMPEEHGGRKGRAALHSGSVRKLTYLVGLIGGLALYSGKWFYPVEPSRWKGQVPKEITFKRMARAYGIERGRDHNEVDAIGIGHWYIHKRKGGRRL